MGFYHRQSPKQKKKKNQQNQNSKEDPTNMTYSVKHVSKDSNMVEDQ